VSFNFTGRFARKSVFMNVAESAADTGSREPMPRASHGGGPGEEESGGLVVYASPEVTKLCAMVASARGRLAELEAAYTSEKARVDALQGALFRRLRSHYERRDRLRLVVTYRLAYLKTLQQKDRSGADWIAEEFQRACARSSEEYRRTESVMAGKRELSAEEEGELLRLWKKLVKLYHPDLVATDPEKQETYEKLTREINNARDNGDLETLRQIGNEPDEFLLRRGWAKLDFADAREAAKLRRLWENLETEIVSMLQTANHMKDSAEYELYRLTSRAPEIFEETVAKQMETIEQEMAALQSRANGTGIEIAGLDAVAAERIG
jgi:hypothetical protein